MPTSHAIALATAAIFSLAPAWLTMRHRAMRRRGLLLRLVLASGLALAVYPFAMLLVMILSFQLLGVDLID